MGFLVEKGFTMQEMAKNGVSPVVFHEHVHYFKEAFHGQPITVSLEVSGLSADGMFFKFDHNFYNHKGENLAYCEIFGAWIDLSSRKLSALPSELLALTAQFPKSKDFKLLTKEDTRIHGRSPVHLNH